MKKFQVTISFSMDDEFMSAIPAHRRIIDRLIEDGVLDHYVVSMQSMRSWMTITAPTLQDVEGYLAESPLHRYWEYEIDEIFVLDGAHYRLPILRYN